MKTKYIILSIIGIILLIFGSITISDFLRDMTEEKMEVCGELDNTIEAYFECLEQNAIDTWDMEHREKALQIYWWINFVGFMFVGLVVLVVILGIIHMIFDDSYY